MLLILILIAITVAYLICGYYVDKQIANIVDEIEDLTPDGVGREL